MSAGAATDPGPIESAVNVLSAYGLVVVLPLLALLIWTTTDIWRRAGVKRRGLWTLGCWLFWPTMLGYFALRPLGGGGGNRQKTGSQGDPRSQLVAAILDHDEGRLDDAAFQGMRRDLRERERAIPGAQ